MKKLFTTIIVAGRLFSGLAQTNSNDAATVSPADLKRGLVLHLAFDRRKSPRQNHPLQTA